MRPRGAGAIGHVERREHAQRQDRPDEFLALVNGLFVDPAAEAALTALYGEFTGERAGFAAVAREKKLQALHDSKLMYEDQLVTY